MQSIPWGLLIAIIGITLFTILAIQMLVGYRKIHFRGPLHLKIHRSVAWVMLAVAVVHGSLGLLYVTGRL